MANYFKVIIISSQKANSITDFKLKKILNFIINSKEKLKDI